MLARSNFSSRLAVSFLFLPLIALIGSGCASMRRGTTVDVADNATVIQEDAHPDSPVRERLFILEQGTLTAIKTYFKDGSREVRFFRPDRTAFVLSYRDGHLVSESQLDAEGKIVSKRTYVWGADGLLKSVIDEPVDGTHEESAPLINPGDHLREIRANGVSRNYRLHVPPGLDRSREVPLVIALHGAFGDADEVAFQSELSAKADQAGFIVVYPNAVPWIGPWMRTWNVGNALHHPNVNDVAYVAGVIDMVSHDLPVDPRRVYVVGISMGAMLTYELATRLSHKVAAIGAVSGSMEGSEVQPKRPVPVVIIHGTDDSIVPYLGGGFFSGFLSAPNMQPTVYTRRFWALANQATHYRARKVSDHVLHEVFDGGPAPVEQYTIMGGTHNWPDTSFLKLWKKPTGELEATDVIWEFLSRHTL